METETVEDRIEVLLANLEVKNQQYTDLMRLAVSDNYEILVGMLQTISPEVLFRKDLKGRTALDWARLQNNQRTISLISQAMAKALNAARKQRAGIVDSIEVVTKTNNGKLTEALARAIEEKNADKILKILTHSHLSRDVVADLDAQVYFTDFTTKQGDTPLIRCAGLGFYDVVLELIDMKADIEAQNQYGQTALTWAALCGHAEVVRVLLSKGADIFHQTREGRSCLHYACRYVKGRVVSVIFDYLFEKFSSFRANKHPFTKYDPKRWTNYAEIMEEFTMLEDIDGFTAVDLIPSNAAASSSVYDSADVVVANESSLLHIAGEEGGFEVEVALEDRPHDYQLVSDFTTDGNEDRESTVKNDVDDCRSGQVQTIDAGGVDGIGGSVLDEEPDEASSVEKRDDTSDQWSLGESRQTQDTHTSAYFSTFLTNAYSLKTAESESVEVYAIYNILRVVNERIESWHHSSEMETKMAAPVMCWNGCGHKTKFEAMTTHVRESCTHKPTVCGSCSEVHPAYHMHTHLTRECCKRLLACPNTKDGCRSMVQAHYMDTHIRLRCPYRLAYCRLQCGKQFPVVKRDDHEKNHCKKREIECHMCHNSIPSIDMPDHIKNKCPCRQVRCKIGCLEWFNVADIEQHEKHECVQPCKWNCGESIGPLQKRVYHELTECLNRAVECRNACGIQGLTARNETDHLYNYCSKAEMPCPNHCGEEHLNRENLHQHLDPWHGTCPDRFVRCPSNLVGWRVLYNNREEGIVVKYRREECFEIQDEESEFPLPDRGDRTWCADGVDMISVRFESRHEWIPFWTSDIVPLRRAVNNVKGDNSSDGEYLCGWMPYSELGNHLTHDCPNRVVLIGAANPKTEMTYGITVSNDEDSVVANGSLAGTVNSVESFVGTESLMSSLNAFDGQAARAKSCVQIAQVRHDVNAFLVAPPENITCDYCSMEVAPDRIEWHVKMECTHVLVRCRFGCGTKIMRRQLEYHMVYDCPKRNVLCGDCNMEMWADELQSHKQLSCSSRHVECENNCGATHLTAGIAARHLKEECINRLYTCECGMTFVYNLLSDHLIMACATKPGLCPQGCGLVITRNKVDYHMEFDCPKKNVFQNKLVPCPLNCGQRLKRVDVLQHVSYYCELRLTECPYRCGSTFRKEKLGDHMKICPNRPLYCERGMPTCQFKLHQWFWQEEDVEDDFSINTEPDHFAAEDELKDLELVAQSPHSRHNHHHHSATLKGTFSSSSGRLIPQANFAALAIAAQKNKTKVLGEDDDLGSVDSVTLSIAKSSSSVSYSEGRLVMREELRLQSCPKHGRNLLMYAVRYNELPLAKYIIDKTRGEDLDLQDKFGDTAMTLACRLQNVEFVELLIHYGADVNMETTGGKTPLIEATKVNNRKIVEMLITAGSVVKFKTKKHAKCAADWAQIMKNEDLYIYLDIGSIVQTQMEEMFRAISRGDEAFVYETIKDGEFFTPSNSTRFQEAMERYVDMSKECRVIVEDYSKKLKSLQEDAAAKHIIYLRDQAEQDIAVVGYDKHMAESKVIRAGIGSRFEVYDKKIATIRVFDIEEIINNRKPAMTTRIAVLAYALLWGLLDTSDLEIYRTDMVGIHSWWPSVMRQLLNTSETIKKLKTFSWISLQSPHLKALGLKICRMYGDFEKAYEEEAQTKTEASHLRWLLAQQEDHDMTSVATENSKNVGEQGSVATALHTSSQVASVGSIPIEEWDSDDENAGGGEWVKGKWVPKIHVKTKWWDHNATTNTTNGAEAAKMENSSAATGFKKKRTNVIIMAEKLKELEKEKKQQQHSENVLSGESSVQISDESVVTFQSETMAAPGDDNDSQLYEQRPLESDSNSTTLVLVECMRVLMSAVTAMVLDMGAITSNTLALRDAKAVFDEKKRLCDMSKQKYESVQSKCNMIETEMNHEVQKLLLYRRRIEQNKQKLRVTRLLNSVSPCGHTIISWAAATGSYESIEHLLSHGATVGYTEELVHMSASVIQTTFRLFLYHSSYAKRRKIQAQQAAADAVEKGSMLNTDIDLRKQSVMSAVPVMSAAAAMNAEEGSVHSRGTHGVEELFELKSLRELLVNRLNRRRRNIRFPVPEAAYNGYAHIVSRIYFRKLLHFNFIGSWLFPSPAFPRPRVHRRLELDGKKFMLMEIAHAGRQQFGAGMLVQGRGWFPRLSAVDPFTEAFLELKSIWDELCEAISNKIEERKRVRMLVLDGRRQIIYKKEMDNAIRTADFKKCIEMAVEDKCTIDFETEDGLTALIVAAEENIGGLHHHYVINDDFEPVLAVAYLLDRSTHAPAVNVETKFGNTALLHACALGREHVVEALLNRHADMHQKNRFGQNAIHVAALNGSTRCVRLLLDRGADSKEVDNQGRTPYDLALAQGFTDVLTILGQRQGGFLGPVTVDRGAIDERVNCPMGCGKFMNRFEIPEHLPECLLRTVACPLGCDDPHVIARDVDHHLKNDCPHRPMECEKCHAIIRTCDDQKHQNKLCPHRLLLCVLGCNTWVPAFEMVAHRKGCLYKIMECPEHCGESYPIVKRLEHTRHHCINRRVVCPLKCAALIVFHTLPHHTNDVCPRRPMTCKWCRDPAVEYRHWAKHEVTCSHRLVACSKHCGAMVQERDMASHLQDECVHRFIDCPLKCSYKARVVDMQTHLDKECDNRVIDCPLGCSAVVSGVAEVVTRMLAKQAPLHLKADCMERMIHCGACGVPMKAKEIPHHARTACEMRLVGCRLGGCLKKVPFRDREKHETFECKYRLAMCPMGCGLRLVSYKMQRHQDGTCDMRQVECPLGCGMVLRQVVLSSHMENECSKRPVNYGGNRDKKSPSTATKPAVAFKKKELAAFAVGAMMDGRTLSPPPAHRKSSAGIVPPSAGTANGSNQDEDRHSLPPI